MEKIDLEKIENESFDNNRMNGLWNKMYLTDEKIEALANKVNKLIDEYNKKEVNK